MRRVFLNFIEHQNHLQGLLTHGLLAYTRVPDSAGLGRGLRI